jgi:hypothetical protein
VHHVTSVLLAFSRSRLEHIQLETQSIQLDRLDDSEDALTSRQLQTRTINLTVTGILIAMKVHALQQFQPNLVQKLLTPSFELLGNTR